MCSASDDILLVSSNVQRQIYLVSVAKDGIGLVVSVSELVAYPEGTDKVISMTVNNGYLYFSSEGHGGGLFQVNLGSTGCPKLNEALTKFRYRHIVLT